MLDNAHPNLVTMDNIHPMQNTQANKIVHTTAGPQISGIDPGHSAVKWVFRKIKEFARTCGFDIKKISSSTRYTGARAKNNPTTDDTIDNFNVSVNVEEEFVYNIDNDTIKYIFE